MPSSSSSSSTPPALSSRILSAGLTPARLICGLLVLLSLALGIWLVVLGAAQRGAECEVALASYSTLDGSFFLAGAAVGGAAAFVFLRHDGEAVRGEGATLPLAAGLTFVCCLAALLMAWVGVKIYGTVLLFGNSLWSRQQAAVAAASALTEPPCAPALYQPLAVYVIVCWTLPVLLVFLAVLAALAWSLWEAYAYATDAGRAKREEEEGRNEPNPWLNWEGSQPAWELREDDEADKLVSGRNI